MDFSISSLFTPSTLLFQTPVLSQHVQKPAETPAKALEFKPSQQQQVHHLDDGMDMERIFNGLGCIFGFFAAVFTGFSFMRPISSKAYGIDVNPAVEKIMANNAQRANTGLTNFNLIGAIICTVGSALFFYIGNYMHEQKEAREKQFPSLKNLH